MEKIILGMLMLKGMTIYEMKVIINTKLSSMCSSSSGSIHSAIGQLMKKGFIGCKEEENKKIYFITKAGREEFNAWILKPMNQEKAKNIEQSKFFYLGMTEQRHVVPLIQAYIADLQEDLILLRQIIQTTSSDEQEILLTATETLEKDEWNGEGIKKNLFDRDVKRTVTDIYKYQMETLRYGMDTLEFEIQWYENFLRRMSNDERRKTGL